MARRLPFIYNDKGFTAGISKVDRSKLYGTVELEVLDDSERKCELATLASDGQTLIPFGGTAFAYVSPSGEWCDRKELKPVDLEGKPLKAVESSFKMDTELVHKASIEEYLAAEVRLIYVLEDGTFPEDLLKELKSGEIYKFTFSYRGGVDPDTAFMLMGKDEAVWMMIGKPTQIEFIGLDQTGAVGDDDDESGDSDDMDFGMI